MTEVLVGTVAGAPLVICVPDGWTGQVEVVLNVHEGRPSKKYRVVKHTVHELGSAAHT